MTPAAVLEAVNHQTRLITDADLAVLFGVTPRIIRDRSRRGELPDPLSRHPWTWSPQQVNRFLDAQEATS